MPRRRTSKLAHKARDHAMEMDAIVEASLCQINPIRCCQRHLVQIQLHLDITVMSTPNTLLEPFRFDLNTFLEQQFWESTPIPQNTHLEGAHACFTGGHRIGPAGHPGGRGAAARTALRTRQKGSGRTWQGSPVTAVRDMVCHGM